MNKKSSVSVVIVCCLLILTLIACSGLPADRDKILVGSSDNWSARICMVDQGTTRIVMGPGGNFDYPDTIKIELQSKGVLIYSDILFIERPANFYDISFLTIESAYEEDSNLTLIVHYNGLSEEVTLWEYEAEDKWPDS